MENVFVLVSSILENTYSKSWGQPWEHLKTFFGVRRVRSSWLCICYFGWWLQQVSIAVIQMTTNLVASNSTCCFCWSEVQMQCGSAGFSAQGCTRVKSRWQSCSLFWRHWGRIHTQVHSGGWQNLGSCGCEILAPVFLLAVVQGQPSAPRDLPAALACCPLYLRISNGCGVKSSSNLVSL